MNCKTCGEQIDAHVLICSGPCCSAYHVSCLTKTNSHYKNALVNQYMSKIPNIRWYCNDCIKLPMDEQHRMLHEVTSQLHGIKSFVDHLLTSLSSLTTQTDINNPMQLLPSYDAQIDEDLNNVSNEQNVSMESISPESSTTDGGSTSSAMVSNVNTKSRKRRHDSPAEQEQQSKQQKVGEKIPLSLADMIAEPQATPAQTPHVAANITVRTNMTRSIYISPFKPTIEPADILNHLNSIEDLKYIAPDIKCTKLINSKKRNQRISFVSFKLDVQRHYYDMVVNPAHWPTNDGVAIKIQEFVDKRAPTPPGNPFSQHQQSQRQGARQPANSNANGNGNNNSNSGRPHANSGNSNSNGNHRGGQNFPPGRRNQRRRRPMPHCSQCHGRYEENRFGRRRPSNRR